MALVLVIVHLLLLLHGPVGCGIFRLMGVQVGHLRCGGIRVHRLMLAPGLAPVGATGTFLPNRGPRVPHRPCVRHACYC